MTNVSGLRQRENPSSTTGVADLTESEIDAVAGGSGAVTPTNHWNSKGGRSDHTVPTRHAMMW
jgi:hypothetical protein